MSKSMLSQISALQRMSVSDLQVEWLKLYGEPTRSRNRQFLFRRLAWRIQELQHGGLSNAAKNRIDKLTPVFTRTRTSTAASTTFPHEHRPRRDPRIPSSGTLITKAYKGRELRVVVRDDGLELDGKMYSTATALAKAVTGSRSINGWLFLGIAKRKRN